MHPTRLPFAALLALVAALASPGHARAQAAESWGYNLYGQLGNGTTTQSNTPGAVSNLRGGVTAVAGGLYHSLAVQNGAAYAWGHNGNGQLGDGTNNDSSTPVTVSDLGSGVTAVAGGQYHSLAIQNGAALAWGHNGYGQLGNGTNNDSSTPVAVSGLRSGVTAVAGGGSHSLGIQNGAAYAWGFGGYGQLGNGTGNDSLTPVAVSNLGSGVTAVAAGKFHSLAVQNGAVYAWGYNGDGELGNGTENGSSTPAAVSSLSSGVTAVAGGGRHSLAVQNGAVYAWGYNGDGELGNGTTTDSLAPIQVDAADLTNIVSVASSDSSSYALASDGSLWVWGDNSTGQLGLGTSTAQYLTPQHLVPPVDFAYTAIYPASLGFHALAILSPILTVLHTFTGTGGDGGGPDGVLIQANDNNFYGTAAGGGTDDNGTIFQLSADGGTYATLLGFDYGASAGDSPLAALTQTSDGSFYGTTYDGSTGDQGTVFRVSPDGQTLTTLVSFGDVGSGGSTAGLFQASDGFFYGTTTNGGTYGNGTVFRVSPDGQTFTTLHSFTGANGEGSIPAGGLIQGGDGNFYGTTTDGGTYGYGTLFELSADGGTYTTLHMFTDAEGGVPQASLFQGRDGNFYGTISVIGTGGNGPVFRLSADGKTVTMLPGGGYGSDGTLIQASDGNFYGTTTADFAPGGNTLFELSADGGTYTTLHTFTDVQGEGTRPETGLLQGSDGNLYGTTYYGGTKHNGAVFRLNVALPDVVQFHAAINSVNETAGTASVRVDRIGGSGALAVAYQTADGTAVALTDYTPATGALVWQAGDQTPKFITVTIANRGFTDGSLRTLSLTLSSPLDLSETTTLGYPAMATLTIDGSIPGAPVIQHPHTATAVQGAAFVGVIDASATPTSYGATGLPDGLSVDATTGKLSGKATGFGVFNVTLSATNAAGTGTAALTLTVREAKPAITSANTDTAQVGQPYSYQIVATGGTPLTYAASGLFDGLSVNAQTGKITGTPKGSGPRTLTLRATNAAGTTTQTLTLTVNPKTPVITSDLTVLAMAGESFSYQIKARSSPTSFGVSGSLDGLSVNTATGALTGKPTAGGTFSITLTASNAGGTGQETLTLTVRPVVPVITVEGTATATVGQPFSYQIEATGEPTLYGVGGLFNGIIVNEQTGQITGTPTVAGTHTLQLRARNESGEGTQNLTVTVSK